MSDYARELIEKYKKIIEKAPWAKLPVGSQSLDDIHKIVEQYERIQELERLVANGGEL